MDISIAQTSASLQQLSEMSEQKVLFNKVYLQFLRQTQGLTVEAQRKMVSKMDLKLSAEQLKAEGQFNHAPSSRQKQPLNQLRDPAEVSSQSHLPASQSLQQYYSPQKYHFSSIIASSSPSQKSTPKFNEAPQTNRHTEPTGYLAPGSRRRAPSPEYKQQQHSPSVQWRQSPLWLENIKEDEYGSEIDMNVNLWPCITPWHKKYELPHKRNPIGACQECHLDRVRELTREWRQKKYGFDKKKGEKNVYNAATYKYQ